MDTILEGMTDDYDLVKFHAMKDSTFPLHDLKVTTRSIILNHPARTQRGPVFAVSENISKPVKCFVFGTIGHIRRDLPYPLSA